MRRLFLFFAAAVLGPLLASCATQPSSTDDSITVLARFSVTPGREAEAEGLFLKAVAFVANAEPATTYRVFHSKKDPTVFVFYEVYANSAALENHSKVTLPAMAKEYGAPPSGLFSRPPEIERFSPVRAGK
jgi:quinol monooxygenase YgiN